MRYISPWIYTTYDCNLSCKYCYVHASKKVISDITLNNISSIFGSMLDSNEVDYVVFRIAGGEPLLHFDVWKDTFQQFYQKYRGKVFISLLSNMTVLTDEMLQWFGTVNCGFGLSLDSLGYSKPFHNGISSGAIASHNIDRLINSRGSNNLDISTVIDSKSFDDCELLAHWVATRNLNWGIYLDHYFCGEIPSEVVIDKMSKVINILADHKYDFLNKFKFNNLKLDGVYEGCNAGDKLIAIGCDGEVWPCQTLQREQPIFHLGDTPLLTGLKEHNTYHLGEQYTLPTECNKCSLANECRGGCRLHNKDINRGSTCDILKNVQLLILRKVVKEAQDAKL